MGLGFYSDFTVTLKELSSSIPLASARLELPGTFDDITFDAIANIEVKAADGTGSGKTWTGGLVGYVLSLWAEDGASFLGEGESVSATFTAKPDAVGVQEVKVQAWTDVNVDGGQVVGTDGTRNYPDDSPGNPVAVLPVTVVNGTIQGAIDTASPGDTISVAAGTYNEKVYINKPVNLQSVKGPESTIISYAGNHSELLDWYVSNTITVFKEGSGSTIKGFKILNNGTSDWVGKMQVGIRVLDGVDGLNIVDNIIDDVLRGILLNDRWTYDPAQINKNVSISNVIIKNNRILNSNMGIDIVFGDNITVDDNKIIFSSSAVHQPHVGISLRHGVSNIDITKNLVQGYTGYTDHFGAGIALGTDNSDWPYQNPNGIKNVIIKNNEFSNNEYGMIFGNWAGLVNWQNPVPMSNINTSHNLISNNQYGVIINPSAQDKAKEGFVLVISHNKISGNVKYGIFAYSDFSGVDARLNWWGDASGPFHDYLNLRGLGNAVSDNVLFGPWWVNEEMSIPSNWQLGSGGGGFVFDFTFDLPLLPGTGADTLVVEVGSPITAAFVTQGTAADLAAAKAAYQAALQALNANRATMSAAEIAIAELDLAVALAAILTLELVLGTADADLAAAVAAYQAAVAAFAQHGGLLTGAQQANITAILAAVAAQLTALGAVL